MIGTISRKISKNILQVSFLWYKNFQTLKNYVVKHIESDYPRHRYQADTVYLTDYISNDAIFIYDGWSFHKVWMGNFNEK